MAETSLASEKIRQIYFAIGLAITQWQGVEQALTQLFAIMLQGDNPVASGVFNSVRSFHNKLDMIRAAAVVSLKDTTLLDECLSICDKLEKKVRKRNDIAHFMLYQGGNLVLGPGNTIPDAKELERRVEWYLSPTAFDSARDWRFDGKPPELKTVDIMNRANAFIKASNDIWNFSEKVRVALKRPQASP